MSRLSPLPSPQRSLVGPALAGFAKSDLWDFAMHTFCNGKKGNGREKLEIQGLDLGDNLGYGALGGK